MRRWACAGLVACLVGCGDGPGGERLEAAVDTVGGVERLRYPASPTRAVHLTADTAFVLGDAFAEDAYQFEQVSRSGLAGDAAGALYVLDRQGSRVLKYGPDGRHQATYGRRGEGPGELSRPSGLAVGPGDTVWVSEFGFGGTGRLTGFPQDGGEPRVLPYRESVGAPSQELAVLAAGIVQSFRQIFGPRGPAGGLRGMAGGGSDGERRVPLLRLGPALEVLDTVWVRPEPPTDVVQLDMGGRVMIMMMAREFSAPFQWHALSDGTIAVSDSAAYLIRLIDPDGTVRRIIERDPAPRPVTEADREAARQRVRAAESGGGGLGGVRMGGGGGGPDADTQRRILEQRLEKMTFADVVPRVVSLRVDSRDRIWVGVSMDVAGELARIDIYDRDGTLLGEIRDFGMPDVFVGPDRAAFLGRDELDVQQVAVVRLRGLDDSPAASD